MIVQNNLNAPVFLAIVILIGAIVFGLLLTNTELFNPTKTVTEANARATASALQVQPTQAVIAATETPRAFFVQQRLTQTVASNWANATRQANTLRATETSEAIMLQWTVTAQAKSAQATDVAIRQAETRANTFSTLEAARTNATITTIVVRANSLVQEAQAKQTGVARQQSVGNRMTQATLTAIAQTPSLEENDREQFNRREWVAVGATAIAVLMIGFSIAVLVVAIARAKVMEASAKLSRERRHTLEVEETVRSKRELERSHLLLVPPVPETFQPAVDKSRLQYRP